MRKKHTDEQTLPWLVCALILLLPVGFLILHPFGETKEGADADANVSLGEVLEELSFGVYGNEDWEEFFSSFHGDVLTGEMLSALIDRLNVRDYMTLPEIEEKQKLTRETWTAVYEQILDLLDMERSVAREPLLVLDVQESAEGSILTTNRGDFESGLPESYFERWVGYDLYCTGNRCLGIAGISDEVLWVENAYLRQCEGGQADFLFGGDGYRVAVGELQETVAPCVCDLLFSDGKLLSLRVKTDQIEGKLISYDDTTIEIEGYGKIGHGGTLPVYQIYGEVTERSLSDVVIGNMDVAYVTGDGEVCAILIRQPADIQNVRVLLLADGGSKFREAVYLTCNAGASLRCGTQERHLEPGQVVAASELLDPQPDAVLVLTPDSGDGQSMLCDAAGAAQSNGYYGSLEVRRYDGGYTVVNQLPLEQYLWSVVPSEMPSSYQTEALKAQAVCARSYAYIQLLRSDLAGYGAHIDDSTSYQVYNQNPSTEESRAAVEATAGQIMTFHGKPVEAYYFSTSMGYTGTAEVWNVEDADGAYPYLRSVCLNESAYDGDLSTEDGFLAYIRQPAAGYDSDIKFYRWTAEADYSGREEEINGILNDRRAVSEKNVRLFERDGTTELAEAGADALARFGRITGMSVTERSSYGAVLALSLQYEKGVVLVRSEYNIRALLGACTRRIVYADGSENTQVSLLPSAYVSLVPDGDGALALYGGGYGHGIGMSQNGANGMARAGMGYEEILRYFYDGIELSDIQ